jgi:hypothetical protein
MEEVPVQYFQSVIAIQLAVIGALLWNIRYFDRRPASDRVDVSTPNPWLLLLVALILIATLFGNLYSIRHGGQAGAASAVTVGLALSMIPILLRVLPPIRRRRDSGQPPHAAVAVVGLVLCFAVVAGVVVALNG